MGKYIALAGAAVIAAVIGAASLRGGKEAASVAELPPEAAAKAGGKTGFMGNYNYLMEVPAGYEVKVRMSGKTETVVFHPKGASPEAEEKNYRELGIVRLEVTPPPRTADGPASLEVLKESVTRTLKGREEEFTVKFPDLGRACFQVDISKPVSLTQLFLQGGGVFYVFTGGDEKLVHSLAGTIIETGAPAQGG